MKVTDKINFRQPKYMLPAILYLPILFFGYFFFRFFDTKAAEAPSKLETTEYYNDKLPDANLKGDGIGDKYSNMVNNFGKIKDESAVENIERGGEDQKEEYESQYSDAEVAAMDQNSNEAQKSMEKLRKLQAQIREQQAKDNALTNNRSNGNTPEEEETLESLRKALADARNEGMGQVGGGQTVPSNTETSSGNVMQGKEQAKGEVKGKATVNEHSVNAISEDAEAEEAVKKHKEPSEYFNTIAVNEPDDIDVGERTIPRGSYLYCLMSGFGQQRVKGNVKSVLVDDELVKVNLSIYDADGLEGLYVPKSSFSETTKDIASGAFNQSMNLNDVSSNGNKFGNWGMQALQNAYQKASNALSKNIKKNRVKIKYGTQVYLINSKEKKK